MKGAAGLGGGSWLEEGEELRGAESSEGAERPGERFQGCRSGRAF